MTFDPQHCYAQDTPDPDKPIVAEEVVSHFCLGKNAGFFNEAFQELLKALLNAPAGVNSPTRRLEISYTHHQEFI